MSDNSLRSPGGSETIATDEVADGGVAHAAKVQRVKVGVGADGNYKDLLPPADAAAAGNVLPAAGMLYNETAFDQARGNVDRILLASAARTASVTGASQKNYNHRGMILTMSVSAASGTGGLRLSIVGIEALGSGYALWTDTAAVSTVTLRRVLIYPGAVLTGTSFDSAASLVIPRAWRVDITHGDASSYTYSVSCSLIV